MNPNLLRVLTIVLAGQVALSGAAGAAELPDLDVLWIERRPAIEYVWNSPAPEVEGWPREGDPIEWVAHVENRSDGSLLAAYRWTGDGRSLEEGTTSFPQGRSELALPRAWSSARQTIRLEIDTAHRVGEASEINNSLSVATDSLSIGFWVERSFADAIRTKSPLRNAGIVSVEDWLQAQMMLLNAMAALAIYPESPHGVLDRFRIEKVVTVPDGALPLTPPPPGVGGSSFYLASHFPDSQDRTIDLQWGFTAEQRDWYDGDGVRGYFGHSLMHEIGHARYLVDVYLWNVGARRGDQIALQPHPPVDRAGYVHRTPLQGLMNSQYGFIDRYSAAALNRIALRRATRGNYNAPENFGEFLDEAPTQNRVRLRTRSGEPLSDRTVRLYTSDFARRFDAVPEAKLQSDSEGVIEVGRNPFGVSPLRDPSVAIVAAEWNGQVLYGFLESLWFQLAAWRGETASATHDLVLGDGCPAVNPPLLHQPFALASGLVTLRWSGVDDATGYRVMAWREGAPAELITATNETVVSTVFVATSFWWVEADRPGCDAVRSDLGVVVMADRARRRPARR